MAHFKASTAKRQWAFSNSRTVGRLDKGRLVGWKSSIRTTEVYLDKTGKKRWKGTSQLKKTEPLGTDQLFLERASNMLICFVFCC